MTKPQILIACEKSQIVTSAFRNKGLKAFSCDIEDCYGNHPEWHIKDDIRNILKQDWKMIIAFPPCTHLTVSGARWFHKKQINGEQKTAIDFFMLFTDLACPHIAIENPVGIMSSKWRKPDQIIQPYEFGDDASKRTCLWLKNLPILIKNPTNFIKGKTIQHRGKTLCRWSNQSLSGQNLVGEQKYRSQKRSQTYPGIAKAMAEQWGSLI